MVINIKCDIKTDFPKFCHIYKVGLGDHIDVGIYNCDVFLNIVMLMCIINNRDVSASQVNGIIPNTGLHPTFL